MLSYFPAYQFSKVFKEMKQNNDFQLDIIAIHNTSYACLHQNMHFFPQAWLSRWRLLNFNQKVFQTVKSKEYPCDKNKKVTKTNGYFSTGCLAFLTLRLFRAASAPIIVCTIIINFSFLYILGWKKKKKKLLLFRCQAWGWGFIKWHHHT